VYLEIAKVGSGDEMLQMRRKETNAISYVRERNFRCFQSYILFDVKWYMVKPHGLGAAS
jgi:hypothetical protein